MVPGDRIATRRVPTCPGVRTAQPAARRASIRPEQERRQPSARRTGEPRSGPLKARGLPEQQSPVRRRPRPSALRGGGTTRGRLATGPDAPEGHRHPVLRARFGCEVTRSWEKGPGVYRLTVAGYDTGFLAFSVASPLAARPLDGPGVESQFVSAPGGRSPECSHASSSRELVGGNVPPASPFSGCR